MQHIYEYKTTDLDLNTRTPRSALVTQVSNQTPADAHVRLSPEPRNPCVHIAHAHFIMNTLQTT